MPTLSCGARRCLALLSDLAHGPLGACPSRRWLARRLECSVPTLDRWTRELRAAGYLATKKRQHHSAVYTVQNYQHDRSGDSSGDSSGRRYKGRVLVSAEEMWPKSPAESQPNPEWDEIVKWATEARWPLETGGDVLRVQEAMLAARKRPAGREESYRRGADTAFDGVDRLPKAAGAS